MKSKYMCFQSKYLEPSGDPATRWSSTKAAAGSVSELLLEVAVAKVWNAQHEGRCSGNIRGKQLSGHPSQFIQSEYINPTFSFHSWQHNAHGEAKDLQADEGLHCWT